MAVKEGVKKVLRKVMFKDGKIVASGHLSANLDKEELEKQIRELEKQINCIILKVVRK